MLNLTLDDNLKEQLYRVEEKIKENLSSGDSYLNQTFDYLFLNKGKMLRPILLLLGSKFGKNHLKRQDDIENLATAIETLHIATLLHDDVIDDAKIRRGQESIQSKYSKEYAIYLGDFLLSRCFMLLTKLDIPRDLAENISKVVSRICIGEMSQNRNRFNSQMSIMGYLRIVSGKTAALFAIALSAGAYISKADEKTIKRLAHAGYQLGMAFQIVDDLLDFVGDEKVVGKNLKADILQGYYSIPVIFALRDESNVKSELQGIFSENIDDNNIDNVISLIKESGAIEKTSNLAKRYHKRAEKVIEKLPENSSKDALKNILVPLLNRIK